MTCPHSPSDCLARLGITAGWLTAGVQILHVDEETGTVANSVPMLVWFVASLAHRSFPYSTGTRVYGNPRLNPSELQVWRKFTQPLPRKIFHLIGASQA